MQERRLHAVLNQSSAQAKEPFQYKYGDYASVFAGERGMAIGADAIRVDYPTEARWIYHRSEDAGAAKKAAEAVTKEAEWDKKLNIWGTEQIKRASKGDTTGLEYQRDWTAVRINIHLHRQSNFGGKAVSTDEPWTD